MRKISFASGEYYHIYNRGVDKRDVFCDDEDYTRFLTEMNEFKCIEPIGSIYELNYYRKRGGIKEAKLPIGSLASGLVNVICYCLNSNHFHFLLEQLQDRGVEKYMHKIGTGYTKYFNQKHDRSGSLFQGPFKAIHIDTGEYLLWLSAYVNGNASIHKLSDPKTYKWCSYSDYLEKRASALCNKNIVLSQFMNEKEYGAYVDMVIAESTKRKDLKKHFIEEI